MSASNLFQKNIITLFYSNLPSFAPVYLAELHTQWRSWWLVWTSRMAPPYSGSLTMLDLQFPVRWTWQHKDFAQQKKMGLKPSLWGHQQSQLWVCGMNNNVRSMQRSAVEPIINVVVKTGKGHMEACLICFGYAYWYFPHFVSVCFAHVRWTLPGSIYMHVPSCDCWAVGIL